MTTRPFTPALAILLTVTLVAPSVFLVVPQRVHANVVEAIVIGDVSTPSIKRTVESVIQTITQKLTEINTATTAWAQQAAWWNANVLQPLAFVLAGNLMKALTAGVIQFVIGKANGTGIPQFVTDVQKSMQTVGDAKALAFFDQFGRNSNSPFASSIASSLRKDYLSKTSLAGFWAANMNTLAQSTPSYAPGYLAGNWQQGGIRAWFALTTQVQNNPYTFYQNSQDQLGTIVGPGTGGATGARMAELNWGQGFMSWCGASDTTLGALTTTNNASPASCPAGSYWIASAQQCQYSDNSVATPLNSSTGVNPGDACIKDGVTGTIKTPGSVIVATLNKVLGGQQDQIVRMGNVGPQINQILGNISTVMQTVQFASQILGGPGSGGLFGVDQPSGSNSTSRLMQYQTTPNLGITNTNVYQNAATASASDPSSMLNRIAQYQSAWGTISVAANAAAVNVTDLITYCNAQKTDPNASLTTIDAQVSAAQAALSTEVAPVLARVATASTTAATATAFAQKVQNELKSGIDTAGSVYAADAQTLQTMSPTGRDVSNVQQEAQAFGTAAASPAGSLTVSGGSLIDQMSLISTNAVTLKNACAPVTPTDTSSGGP